MMQQFDLNDGIVIYRHHPAACGKHNNPIMQKMMFGLAKA